VNNPVIKNSADQLKGKIQEYTAMLESGFQKDIKQRKKKLHGTINRLSQSSVIHQFQN